MNVPKSGPVFIAAILLCGCASSDGGRTTDADNVRSVKEQCRKAAIEFGIRDESGAAIDDAAPSKRMPPQYPFNRPDEWFVCVGVGFDVNDEGRPENLLVLYKYPEDASRRYKDEAFRAIQKWRYSENMLSNQVKTVITYEMM